MVSKTTRQGSYLAGGKIRYFGMPTKGNISGRFKGDLISQSAYKQLGGRTLSDQQFRSAERGEKNPLTLWGGSHTITEESGFFGGRRYERKTQLTGLKNVRTKVGDASLLSETMKSYANPYLLFRSLGLQGDAQYSTWERTDEDRRWKFGSRDFSMWQGAPATGSETHSFEYMIDQDTQAAVLDYERSSRSAFMNSFFSREY